MWRDPDELTGRLGHIRGVTNIPVTHLPSTGRVGFAPQAAKIVTVCKSGGRAHTAAQILMQAGFPKVHVMVGGMTG